MFGRIALVAETAADARDVIVEGDSGILRCAPPWFRPVYEPSKRKITFPNGAIALTYNAVEPDQLRGPQFDFAWCDELAKWRYVQETWDNLQFGLRLERPGRRPLSIVTTTPRPIRLIRELVADDSVFVTRGNTLDNSENLAASFIKAVRKKYEGTRLGRQELNAEILDDMPGALWTRDTLERAYIKKPEGPVDLSQFVRIVVAIDPTIVSGVLGALVTKQYSWDYTNQRIVAYDSVAALPVKILEVQAPARTIPNISSINLLG